MKPNGSDLYMDVYGYIISEAGYRLLFYVYAQFLQ